MLFANIAFRSYLNKGEKILFAAHTHPFVFAGSFSQRIFFGVGLPALFFYLMPPLYFLWGAWAAIGLLIFILELCNWYFDAWLITNEAVIDIDWVNPFNKTAQRVDYSSIDGVSYQFKGFFGTILNYGDMTIERIGVVDSVNLPSVSRPRHVERKLIAAQGAYMEGKMSRDHQNLKDILSSMVQTHKTFK